MSIRLVIVCLLSFSINYSTASGHDVSSKISAAEKVIEAAHMRANQAYLTSPLKLETPSHPASKVISLKKRLRPGLATLGRGLVRATLSKDAIISRARGLLTRESRQHPGLVAGALAYGLASLPVLTLPLLFMGPMAYKKLFSKEDEKAQEEEKLTQTLDQIFSVASEIITSKLNTSSPTTNKLAQALGLNPSNLSEEPYKPNSAAAAAISGDALFNAGLFNSGSNQIASGKYKQYVFKEGPISTTTTKKPKTTRDPLDALFAPEKRSSQGKSSDAEKDLGEIVFPKDNMAAIAKDVLKTVSEGIRKFELDKTECKERLVCEVSQKYSGSSFKSWATALMHVLDIDTRVEKSKVGKNAVLRTIYRGARSSLTPDKTCADLFPGCA